MSCGIVDHEHTGHRFISTKPRLLKCTKLARERMETGRKTYVPAGGLTLPQKENEIHDEDIKS